ncbi:MAG: hypothetical protein H7Y86_16205 [Rhizobacter sp.]|nr:hypothetical protein [Ferruginibacter sp.]
MNRYSIFILLILLFSCDNNNDKENATLDAETETGSIVIEKGVPVYNPDSKLYLWRSTDDYKKIKNEQASPAIANTDSLIKGLNEYYENVYLEKVKQSGDTVYAIIKNSEYLTQRMGSTGAEMYIADVVLNLTAINGIRYVKIEMEEGDHAQPGTWSKEDFKTYKEATQ